MKTQWQEIKSQYPYILSDWMLRTGDSDHPILLVTLSIEHPKKWRNKDPYGYEIDTSKYEVHLNSPFIIDGIVFTEQDIKRVPYYIDKMLSDIRKQFNGIVDIAYKEKPDFKTIIETIIPALPSSALSFTETF